MARWREAVFARAAGVGARRAEVTVGRSMTVERLVSFDTAEGQKVPGNEKFPGKARRGGVRGGGQSAPERGLRRSA